MEAFTEGAVGRLMSGDLAHDCGAAGLIAAAAAVAACAAIMAAAGVDTVMASYSWGERRVVNLIKTLPDNPRDRNFWLPLRDYRSKVPDETYKYERA